MSRDINTTVRYLLTQDTTFVWLWWRAESPIVAHNRDLETNGRVSVGRTGSVKALVDRLLPVSDASVADETVDAVILGAGVAGLVAARRLCGRGSRLLYLKVVTASAVDCVHTPMTPAIDSISVQRGAGPASNTSQH